MTTDRTHRPNYPSQAVYDTSNRTFVAINNSNHSKTSDYSSNYNSNYSDNMPLNNSMDFSNDDSMSGTMLKVNTMSFDDDTSSVRGSTSQPPTPPVFHLVRKSSTYAPRVVAPAVNQLKVDIYCVHVIMESKMTGAFDPDLFYIQATAPSGRVIKITGDGQYAAQFNADEIGRWNVAMYYSGKYLDGCPVDICDPSQVKVHDLKGSVVGTLNTFYADCTKAGPGELGVDITHKGRPVPARISNTTTPGYKQVSFKPHESGTYEINVHFNKAEVREGDVDFFNPDERQRRALFFTRVIPYNGHIEVKSSCDWEIDYITGWPLICHVTDSTDIAVYGMQDGTVCGYLEMIADCSQVGDGIIDAEVSYGRNRYPCRIKQDKPGVYRVQFKPQGTGTYQVWIKYNGRPVKGSPFIQEIAKLVKPTAKGDGLHRGVLGRPTSFTVDPRGFPGQVSAVATGPSKPVSVQLDSQPDSTIKATYIPTERGLHSVHIRMDDMDIEGSPYKPLIVDPVNVKISGGWRSILDEKGSIPLGVSKEKQMPFDVSNAGPGELTSEVQGPNGKIPVTIDAKSDGKHSVIFTPREEGKHHIHVSWCGYPLTDSPFLGYATREPELQEPYSVRLIHLPVPTLERHPSNKSSIADSFVDSPRRSQEADPSTYRPVEDAYRATEIVHQQQEPVYRPPESVYRSQEPVYRPSESVYNSQEPVYRPTESIYRSQEPVYRSQEPVYRPTESVYRSQEPVYRPPDSVYVSKEPIYKPSESVYNSQEPVHRPQESVYRSQELAHRPTVTVSGPERSQTRVQVLPVHAGNTHLEPTFVDTLSPTRTKPKSNGGLNVPNESNGNPTRPVSPVGPQKITLSGRGLKEGEVDKLAHFSVDGSLANPGKPVAYLKGVNDHIQVTCEPVRAHVYMCTYAPKTPGAYLLYINWNDDPLKGSPFKVAISEALNPQTAPQDVRPQTFTESVRPQTFTESVRPQTFTESVRPQTVPAAVNPPRITAVMEPGHGTLGSNVEMRLDSRYAAEGRLTAKCSDPMGRRVSCHFIDSQDGAKLLKVTPTKEGRHIVEIQHNGNHIMGSPYAIDIRGHHASGLVRVWGPGIENGVIPHFQSTFWVDTTGAASGEMRVRIMGPKGAFKVNVRKTNQHNKIYQCYYDPVEPGIYTITVQWSDIHIGGSPFTVILANSARELQVMLEEFADSSTVSGDDQSVISRRLSRHLPPRELSVDDVILY